MIPALCEVDGRLPPAARADAGRRRGRDARPLGAGDWELEWISRRRAAPARRSTTPLWGAIEAFVGEIEPGARVAPVCCAGFTDSHWLREAFGTVAYGFFPARMDAELVARLIHSADERAPVDDLELGVEFFRHAARTVLG